MQILLVLCFFLIYTVNCYTIPYIAPRAAFNGYSIEDLIYQIDISKWKIVGGIQDSNNTIICQNGLFLSGYEALIPGGYFEKTYLVLPPHQYIWFRFVFALIDDWQTNDTFTLSIDGTSFSPPNLGSIMSSATQDYCGDDLYYDLGFNFMIGTTLHDASNLTMRMVPNTTYNSSIASFAVRRLTLMFYNNINNTASNSYCLHLTNVAGRGDLCPCGDANYYNSSLNPKCTKCHDACIACFGPTEYECITCASGYSFVIDRCIACSPQCSDCFGPGPDQCTYCISGYWLQWNNTCLTSCPLSQQINGYCHYQCNNSQYLLENNQCATSCPSYFTVRSNPLGNLCINPCYNLGNFTYWNGTCSDTCPWPLKITYYYGFYLCSLPCSGTKYLYPAGTCLSACSSPLIPSTWINSLINVCQSPCNASQYYATAGSSVCLSSCNPPLVSTVSNGIIKCVSPCASSSYYYYMNEGSCSLVCNTPNNRTKVAFLNVCISPNISTNTSQNNTNNTSLNLNVNTDDEDPITDTSDDNNSTQNTTTNNPQNISSTFPQNTTTGSLQSTNNTNTTSSSDNTTMGTSHNTTTSTPKKSEKFLTQDVVQAIQTSQMIQTQGQVTSAAIKVSSVLSSANPSAMLLGGLSDMLQYIKYINVTFPDKLLVLFQTAASGSISLSFAPEMSENMQSQFPNHPLPWVFENYDTDSSFLVNFWQTYISFFILLAIIALFAVIKLLTIKFKRFNRVISRVLGSIKWDLVLILFCSNINDVAFYSFFELSTVHFSSAASVFSFLACISCNLLAALIFVKIVLIIRHLRALNQARPNQTAQQDHIQFTSQSTHTKYKTNLESYSILYKASKNSTFFTMLYMLLFLLRIYFSGLVVSALYNFPLMQTIILCSMSLLMVVYLIAARPMESILDLIQLVINEVILLIVNACVFGLVIIDFVGVQDEERRETIGTIILRLNVGFSVLALIFLGVQGVKALIAVVKGLRALKARGATSLVQVALFVLLGEVGEEEGVHRRNSSKTQPKKEGKMLEEESPSDQDQSTMNLYNSLHQNREVESVKDQNSSSVCNSNNSFLPAAKNSDLEIIDLSIMKKSIANEDAALVQKYKKSGSPLTVQKVTVPINPIPNLNSNSSAVNVFIPEEGNRIGSRLKGVEQIRRKSKLQ